IFEPARPRALWHVCSAHLNISLEGHRTLACRPSRVEAFKYCYRISALVSLPSSQVARNLPPRVGTVLAAYGPRPRSDHRRARRKRSGHPEIKDFLLASQPHFGAKPMAGNTNSKIETIGYMCTSSATNVGRDKDSEMRQRIAVEGHARN